MLTLVKKIGLLLCGVVILGSTLAQATVYTCPAPNEIDCVPVKSVVGAWHANGGEMTANSFAPNNQCANVIKLSATESRLLCCYTKCGVFIQDVRSAKCAKKDQSHFLCY